MKKLFVIFVALLAFSSFAKEINLVIDDYKSVPGMDYQIELVMKHSPPQHRLLLDCQSFINGLHYEKNLEKKWNSIWFIMLSGNECEDASNFSKSISEANNDYCLVVDPEEKVINFNEDLSECE